MSQSIQSPRPVTRVVRGSPTSDGAGVKLTRVIGGPQLAQLDPFLLLDEFGSQSVDDYIAGFPDHPHRGFETVTYMLAGRMRHRDNHGNEGLLGPGGVQWMTAGRGIVHSEMPEQEEGEMRGFQLWVNLPAADKMTAPRYQDIPPEQIPDVSRDDGLRARVIAGDFLGETGPVSGIATQPLYLDLDLPAGVRADIPVPPGHAAFAYVFEGGVAFGDGDTLIRRGELAVLGEGDGAALTGGSRGGRLILVAGKPLKEPVARYGPFVMNTREELEQAFRDFRDGRL